jgi:hypothetical protein
MKKLLEFTLDNGDITFIEIEDNESNNRQSTTRSGSDSSNQSNQAQRTFSDALRVIAPTANALLTSLKGINEPDEIQLEFGLKFNGKANVIFTSAETEASFKVGITWKK